MEYAEGGSLHERMRPLFKPPARSAHGLLKNLPSFKRKPCGEAEAKRLLRQIATALHDCHGLGVMRRDLKPKNLVFLTKKKDSPHKLINFGQCNFFAPDRYGRQKKINLTEFLAATMPSKRIELGTHLSVAFQKFGIGKDGSISRTNLRRVLKVNGFPARKIEGRCAEIYRIEKSNYELKIF